MLAAALTCPRRPGTVGGMIDPDSYLLKATGTRSVVLVVVLMFLSCLLGAMIAGWGVWFLIGRGIRRFNLGSI